MMEMMASMSVESTVTATQAGAFDKRPKPASIATVRDKRKRAEKSEKVVLKKTAAGENKIRSRHQTQALREKVRTLPPSLSLDPGFWKTVL